MTDIAPELFDNLQKSFENNLAADKKAAALLEKIEAGNGNYVIAGDYAERVGESLAKSFQTNLSSDVLPDGKMYYNIAEKTIRPLFEEEYGMVSKVAASVQKFLNTKAGIGLNAMRAAYDSDAVKGIVNKVCSYDQYDDAAWVLNDASVSFSRSVVDRTLKANIEFQGKSGRSPKIVRRAGYNCCQWCADLEGTYEYPNTPEDVFRRHDNCRCDVEYDPGTGKVQNVHSKEWRDADERDRIEERKGFGLAVKPDKKHLKTLGLASKEENFVEPHSSPVLIGNVDYADTKAVISALSSYEKEIVNSSVENAVVVTRTGDIIQCFGGVNNVWPDVDLGDSLYGAYVTHNHPANSLNEYSFSDSDIKLFNEYDLQVLRGVDEKYTYELSRISNDVDEPATLYDLMESKGDTARHEQLIEYANRFKVGYRRWV